MQDLSRHPQFQLLIKEIDKSLVPVEQFTEIVIENIPAAILSFDYEYLQTANSNAKLMLEFMEKYLNELNKGYKETEKSLIVLHEIGNKRDPFEMPIEFELAYYDMIRPIINRIKDLREIISSTNKLLT
jgi:hypothetical protein